MIPGALVQVLRPKEVPVRAAIATLLCFVLLSACTTLPPAQPAPRQPTQVNASFSQTWNSVIEFFARKNIPVTVLDRSSGYIATALMRVGPEGASWADCGKAMGTPVLPAEAQYTVLVHGDSTHSTILVSARFTPASTTGYCTSRGVFETLQEQGIKADAEARALGKAPPSEFVPHYATALKNATLWKQPSETGPMFATVWAGTTLKIERQEGEWLLLSYGKQHGWGEITDFKLSATPPKGQ